MFMAKTVVAVTVPGDARTGGKCAASSSAELTVVAVTVPGDARTDGKCAASSSAELTLHNFRTLLSIPPDVCEFTAPDVGIQTLIHRYSSSGDYVEK